MISEQKEIERQTWISSPFGGKYNSYKPSTSNYTLSDLCSSVAHINRFNGAAGHMPNVAAHSIACYEVASALFDEPKYAIFAAIHDLHEAFIGDIATPIQRAMRHSVRNHGDSLHTPDFINVLKCMKNNIDKNIIDTVFVDKKILWEEYLHFINSKEFVAIDEAVMCWEAKKYLKDSSWTKDFFPNAINVENLIATDFRSFEKDESISYANRCGGHLDFIISRWISE